ncbi:MAG: FumA C-terminus/TtdB family hydratase beta subunit [Vulcanimicrobiaceae bacterium]
MATEHHLTPPISESDVRAMHIGDVVYFTGIIWGIRDATYIRIFDQKQPAPVDLRDSVLLHVAPNVRKRADGSYEPMTVGTTTSMRMDRFTEPSLQQCGVRAIIGKGGLSDMSSAALTSLGGVYLAITGGAASVETEQVEAIENVYFEDLMPECLWKFRVRDFGPLTVAMDAHGESIYRNVANTAQERLAGIYAKLGIT